jgi:DNA processing protein
MLSNASLKLFILHKLKGVGPVTLKKLLAFSDFNSLSIDELATRDPKLAKSLEQPNALLDATNAAEIDIELADKSGSRIISFIDDDYPSLLKRTFDCPPFIYIKGQLSLTPDKAVGVIGTREPTAHGKVIAERITKFLVDDGWSIVSGLAIGCDSIAHQCAVSQKAHTIAVLAHGLHTIAPQQNQKLAEQILDHGGALITEYPFGADPIPPYFVKRDRIQAGLSRAIVMVQSDLDGGSLHASRAAIEYKRILAVPYPTNLDISNTEKKIEANLLICSDNSDKKSTLLKCNAVDLDLIFPIKSKGDYIGLLNKIFQ